MQDNQTIKAKSAAMSAIMRDPKLSRIMSDAWGAPPGSTANEKAKNILKSLRVTNANFMYSQDGRGGDSTPTSDFSYDTGVQPSTYPSNFIGPMQEGVQRTTVPGTPEVASDFAAPEIPRPTQYNIAQGIDSFLPEDSPLLGGGAAYEPKGVKTPWYEKRSFWTDPVYTTFEKVRKATKPADVWMEQNTPEWRKAISDKYEQWAPNTVIESLAKETVGTGAHWLTTAFGWQGKAISWTADKERQLIDLISKVPNASEAVSRWLMSDPAEKKDIGHFLDQQPSILNLFKDASPEKDAEIAQKVEMTQAAIDGEIEDPGLTWTQEEADRYYIDLLDRRYTPDPEKWGGITDAAEITDEMIKDKVSEITGFEPTEMEGPVTDEANKSAADLEMMADLFGPNALDNWYEGVDPSMKDYYKVAYENAKSGRGREGFYRDAFSDTEFMQSLGIPKSVIDILPKSGLLAEHLIELKDAVKKDYGLEEMEKKMLDMQNQGLTVEDDLKAHVRGKDEYLGKIEGLITDAETKTAKMDTSNPYVAKRMENYLNYLNILQGKTNQRYIDYLDSSYTVFDRRQQMLENRYNSSFAKAEEDYKDLSAVSTEAYADIKGQLDRIYDTIDIQSRNYESMTDDAIARIQSAANLERTVLGNQMAQLEIDNYGIENLDTPEWKDYDNMIMASEDKDGIVSLGVLNPFTASQLASQSNNDPTIAVNRQLLWLQKYLKQEIAAGNLADSIKGAYADLTTAYAETQEAMTKLGTDEALSAQDKQLYDYYKEHIDSVYDLGINKIESVVKTSLRDTFAGNQTFATDVRGAIKDLAGLGVNFQEDDRNKFVNKYEESIGSDISGILFDSYWKARAGGLEHDEVFVVNGQPISEIIDDTTVSNIIANLVFSNILS